MATLRNKYYGIGLNFGKSINGFFSTSADKKLVLENMKAILLTNPGERVHMPEFGVGLRRFLFELNDAQLAAVIREKIIQQINKYEPLADIMDIQFKQVDNQINIRIFYRLKDVGGETGILEITEQQTI
jgi:phage baseplate assembly protein W